MTSTDQTISSTILKSISGLLLISLLAFSHNAAADTSSAEVQQIAQKMLHVLDYVAVDYGGVVENGAITNEEEYHEQVEFAERLIELANQLPDTAGKPALVTSARELQQAIQQRAQGDNVAALCNTMSLRIIETFDVNVMPRTAPSLHGAADLFMENCSVCHGAQGYGDGLQAAGLQPPPANFHDYERQQHRSVFSLYNTISLGVAGTAMPSFDQLTNEQRWQLAFYVSNFLATDVQRAEGEALFTETRSHPAVSNLRQLTQTTPAQITAQSGDNAAAVLAYLRANPTELQSHSIKPIHVARDSLAASLTAYENDNAQAAYDLAVAAYLEGFELVETPLDSANPQLRKQIESAMVKYREAVKSGVGIETLRVKNAEIMQLLSEAEQALQPNSLASTISFLSAMLILLREGIEAILVLAAIAAVLIKTGRNEMLRYLHLGWISALVLGAVTWVAANTFINISGANRELTEGFTALIAAAMLIYVGFWLHKQTYAMQWQHFIRNKVSQSLSTSALTGLAVVAFLAVYREVFESILFFQTLWLQTGSSGHNHIISGSLTAVALLAVIAWAIFKFSVRLPLKLFFRVNAVFLFLLAVVFAGKGIAALQEAGKLPADPVRFFQIDALGIYPTAETLGIQASLIALAVLLLLFSRYKFRNPEGREV